MRVFARLAVLGVLSLPMFACSATPDGDGVASEELTASAGDFSVGDALVTTARLNLRESPSLRARVLTIMPRGASITVTDPESGDDSANPTGAFYHVDFDGQSGWAHGGYLDSSDGASGSVGSTGSTGQASSGAAAACMSKMARAARSVDGQHSGERCYHYVKEHIGNALGVGFDGVQSMLGGSYETNAYDFARWVSDDPGGRASAAGFYRANVPLDQLPLGAILVWRPGQCGYSSSAGHIEINIGGGRACSDFCGHIKTTCGAPTVVLFRKGC